MLEHNIKQGSAEWFSLRESRPTASHFNRIITREGQSKGFDTYLKEVIQKTHNTFSNRHMQRGIDYEESALIEFANQYHTENLESCGFVTNDLAGCSPDGVFRDFSGEIIGGVEVKSPESHIHKKYIVENRLPPAYYAQVMGSMAICEVGYWWFVSYDSQNKRLFAIKTERNEEWIRNLNALLKEFNQCLAAG